MTCLRLFYDMAYGDHDQPSHSLALVSYYVLLLRRNEVGWRIGREDSLIKAEAMCIEVLNGLFTPLNVGTVLSSIALFFKF